MSASLHVEGASIGYGGQPVLTDVSFSAGPGTSICVLGPNGGGKTTLFRALVGQLHPLAGSVWVDGRPAYVSQSDHARLDFPVTALDVTLMGTLATGRWWLPAGRAERDRAREALARVGLSDRAGVRFGELSGGQRRRVLLARALVQEAAVLLLDEPLAGVDPASAVTITAVFAELRAEGRTLVVASHDVEKAKTFDAVLCLNGRQVAYGPPSQSLGNDVLDQTYGSELIVLPGSGEPVRAVAVQHHDH